MTAVSGWFPRIGPNDDIASGNGGIWVTPNANPADSTQVDAVGIGPIWAGSTLVYNRNNGTTQVGAQVLSTAYNGYRGSSDTRWSGINAGTVFLYSGVTLAQTVPNAFGTRYWQNGVGWITTGDAQGNNRQLVLNGVAQAVGTILDFVVDIGGTFVVYQIATGTYTRELWIGDHMCSIRSDEAPIAGFLGPLDTQPWIVTGTGLPGGVTFVRPTASVMGYAITGILNYPDAKLSVTRPGQLLVVGSDNAGNLVESWIDFTAPRQDLSQIGTVTPPTPDPTPIGPHSPPITSGTIDTLEFLLTDPALQPRSGPSHPQHQTQPDAHGTFYAVKFGDIIPTGRAYEMYTLDDGGIRHREDASGATPMHFTDTRWWPKTMELGEAHAFVTGPHEEVWAIRDPCRVSHVDPVNRKMWAHVLWEDFYWGPDLGHRRTVMLIYDDTAGFEQPGRFVEAGYFASHAGGCRWEAYHAELVYAHGPAEFPDAARSDRKDFYLVGGPATLPELTGCVDPLTVTGLPWNSPTPEPPPAYNPLTEIAMPFPETRAGVLGPGGAVGRPDVAANRIIFDQSDFSDATKVEITKPDDNGMVRFIQANKIINFPGSWGADSPTGGFVRQFELRDPDQRGADESPTLRHVDGSPNDMVFVVHGQGAQGLQFPSAPLFLGPKV